MSAIIIKLSIFAKFVIKYGFYRYPSVGMSNEMKFPVGKPLIFITPEQLRKLEFRDGLCFLVENNRKKQVEGLIQLKIVCPELQIPFLQYRRVLYKE